MCMGIRIRQQGNSGSAVHLPVPRRYSYCRSGECELVRGDQFKLSSAHDVVQASHPSQALELAQSSKYSLAKASMVRLRFIFQFRSKERLET